MKIERIDLYRHHGWREAGENCQWQFARKSSDVSCAYNREVSGSRNVMAPRRDNGNPFRG